MDMNNVINEIKNAGTNKVRIVPDPGQRWDGLHRVEINQQGVWLPIVTGLFKNVAEQIVKQALNRTICG